MDTYKPTPEEMKNINMAAERLEQIAAQIKELQAEDTRIKQWLDAELILDLQANGVQRFDFDGLTIKATVPQNKKIDEQVLAAIMASDERAKPFVQMFRNKIELDNRIWNSLEPAARAIFAEAVTVTPGKTKYEFIKEATV